MQSDQLATGGPRRPSVIVLEAGVVGSLDYKIISAERADDLYQWLKDNKYSYAGDEATLNHYVQKRWLFTVMKIDTMQMKKNKDGSYAGEVTPTRFQFASEKLVYDQYSAGAENDLQQATRIARRMVTHWGMSERLGPVAYRTSEEHPFLGKEYTEQREFSEHTAQVIDEEVARILRSADQRAQELLSEHRGDLEKLARGLIEEEVLEESDIEALIGPSVNKPPVSEVSTAALAPPGSA